MYSSDLIEVLKTFDNKTLKRLHKFLQSPYFNSNQKVVDLFKYISRYAPAYTDRRLAKQQVFKYFFPKENYETSRGASLRRLMSSLFKLVEKFIVYEAIDQEKQVLNNHIHVLKFYSKNTLDNQFQKFFKRYVQNFQDNYPYRSFEFYQNEHLVQDTLFEFYSSRDQKKCEDVLQKSINNIDIEYLTNKLRFACLIYSHQKVRQSNLTISFLSEVLHAIQHFKIEVYPALHIYRHATFFLQDVQNEEDFFQFRALFDKHAQKFPIYEARQLYAYAKNYCVKQVINGQTKYYQIMFKLYKSEIEQKVIYANEKIQPVDLANMVNLGLYLKEFDWVETLLVEHKHKILNQNATDIFQYNMARLLFEKSEYAAAMDMLKTANFKDVHYTLAAKRLLARLYYETDEFDLLESILNSLKVFIHRNTIITEDHKAVNRNFARFLYRIMNTAPRDAIKIEKIQTEINATNALTERTWLLKKLEELNR